MIKIPLTDISGKKSGEIEVSESYFAIPAHKQAMFDTVISERAALRQGTNKTLTKSEVRGGGRKPWRQKGTGRARTGSIRNPHWVGGGRAHGPRGMNNYTLKVNKKVRQLAFRSAWSLRLAEQALIVTSVRVEFDTPSTKTFKKLLENFKITSKNKVLFIHNSYDDNVAKSCANLQNVFLIKEDDVRLEYILGFEKIVTYKDYVSNLGANK